MEHFTKRDRKTNLNKFLKFSYIKYIPCPYRTKLAITAWYLKIFGRFKLQIPLF